LATLERGALSQLSSRAVAERVEVPSYWIRAAFQGGYISQVKLEPRDPGLDFWNEPLDLQQFEKLGHPLSGGTYRLLAVTPSVGGAVETHHALELAWPSQRYAIVLDPVVQQLDGFARDHQGQAPAIAGPTEV